MFKKLLCFVLMLSIFTTSSMAFSPKDTIQETIEVNGKLVTYTTLNDSIIVNEDGKKTIVRYDRQNDQIFVDDVLIKSKKVVSKNINTAVRSSSTWEEAGSSSIDLDLVGLTLSGAIAVISLKTGIPPATVKGVLVATLGTALIVNSAGKIVGKAILYDNYTTYYKNIDSNRPDMKVVHKLYLNSTYLDTITIYG